VVVSPVAGTVLELAYGEAFREPNVFERQLGGAGIRPSLLSSWELSWHQELGPHLRHEAVAFRSRTRDVIVTDEVAEGGISNKGELAAHGVEELVRFEAGPLQGLLSYTYTVADLEEPGRSRRRQPDLPRHKGALAASWRLAPRLTAGAVLRVRGGAPTEYHGALLDVGRATTLDLNLRLARLAWPGAEAALQLRVDNALDARNYDPEPRAPSVVEHPQDGRALFVRLEVRPRRVQP
jgi:outer membrane cobalamin receptor